MSDFLKFYDRICKPDWSLTIYHSSIVDWSITIGYKNTSENYGDQIINIQSCDMELAFAQAQVALKQWLSVNEGGY